MRSFITTVTGLLVLATVTISSCKKTETFTTDTLSDYMPLQVGKYIVYRLDSTVFLNFGKIEKTDAYQVKFEVNAEVQDNLGRPAYRVYRYIRDSAGTQSCSSIIPSSTKSKNQLIAFPIANLGPSFFI